MMRLRPSHNKRNIVFGFLFICFFHQIPAEIVNFSGYYQSDFSIYTAPWITLENLDLLNYPLTGIADENCRLKFSFNPLDWLSLNVAYQIGLTFEDPSSVLSLFFGESESRYRLIDFNKKLFPASSAAETNARLLHNLDRLNLLLYTEIAEINIGRQAISWGAARFVNPTDILTYSSFMEMETEEKAGVDAFRIRIPIGFMQEIDTGIVFGESFLWEKTACFLRSKFYFWESDWTFLSMKFFNSLLFGFDFTKALGSSLIWLETAFVLTDVLKSGYTFGNMDYIRISVGFDYNIAGALYSFIEYHFNSGGCEKAEDYDDYMTSSLYNEGSIDLLARHYLNVGFNYDISSVMSLSAGVLVNMNDFSFSVLPIFKHNIEENIYFSLGASINVGIAPVLDIYSVPPIVMNSEFGSYPSTVFCSIKFYF